MIVSLRVLAPQCRAWILLKQSVKRSVKPSPSVMLPLRPKSINDALFALKGSELLIG